MIPEEFVTCETAKLLKKAGFPQYKSVTEYECCLRPTQAQAMRWLREHEVVVIVDVEYFRYDIKNAKYRYNIYPNDCAKQTRSQYTYPTYEAAAEAGIQAACEYLINNNNE